jgi:hypothetical protein
MSSLPAVFDSIPTVVLWVAAGLGLLVIGSFFSKIFRSVLYRLAQTCLVVGIICGMLFGAYMLFFDQCKEVEDCVDGEQVTLVGVCRDVRISQQGDGLRASFVLSDLSGKLRVVTISGAPTEGAVACIKGRKGTFNGNTTFVESDYQLSPF